MAKVESFTLDHTKVKAPYVRLITVEEGPKGDKISNYDLRLVQPNKNAIPTGGCTPSNTCLQVYSAIVLTELSIVRHSAVGLVFT